MMMRKTHPNRTAFTLLEVLLASLIAILLLSALYFAMDVTLRQTQESRDAVDVDNLSRGVHTRMAMDFSASLGPLPPKSGGNSAASSGSTPSSPSTPTADPSMTTPAAPAAPASTAIPTDPTALAAAAASADPTAAASPVPQAADIAFQAGMIGTDKQLTIFASRLPYAMTSARGLTDTSGGAQQPSDLVRITYWLSQNGGLCRQERPWVTADGVRNSSDPDLSDEAGDTLVQEVSDVTFEYFDGSSWLPEWDGSQPSPDGVTPTGPPRAVKVTLVYKSPSSRPGTPAYEHTVVQVIPVRTAPGTNTPAMITPSTDPGTTSSASPAAASAGTNNAGSNATGSQGTGAKAPSSGTTAPSTAAPSSGAKTPSTTAPSTTAPSSGTKTPSSGTTAPSSGGAKGGK